jgi:hypothetical protein
MSKKKTGAPATAPAALTRGPLADLGDRIASGEVGRSGSINPDDIRRAVISEGYRRHNASAKGRSRG